MSFGDLPQHIAGLANLTILMFFLAGGAVMAASVRWPQALGSVAGFGAWVFFLMAPETMRIGNLVLLSIGLGLVSAFTSGMGYGRAAGRGDFFAWPLVILSVVLSSLVCVASSLLPVILGALVCHLVGLMLTAQEFTEALERSGSRGGGAAIVCALLAAMFADGYLPQAWPVWPYLHAGVTGLAFLAGRASH